MLHLRTITAGPGPATLRRQLRTTIRGAIAIAVERGGRPKAVGASGQACAHPAGVPGNSAVPGVTRWFAHSPGSGPGQEARHAHGPVRRRQGILAGDTGTD